MESTLRENGGPVRSHAKTTKATAASDGVNAQISNLTADVQDLLRQIAHVADPEIARLRAKVEGALTTAKEAIADGTEAVQRRTKEAADATDGYVRDRPWQAIGIAAVVGALAGFLLARR